MARRAAKGARRVSKKVRRTLSHGQAHVHATFNNTIVTITDTQGNAVVAGSAGAAGFKGSRKSTPYAGRVAAQDVIAAATELGLQEVDVLVKGPGPGGEAALRGIHGPGTLRLSVSDV